MTSTAKRTDQCRRVLCKVPLSGFQAMAERDAVYRPDYRNHETAPLRDKGKAVTSRIISLVSGVMVTVLPVLAGSDGTHESPPHFIAFLARPNSILVGHSYVQIGTITRDGIARVDKTIALYPARYPRTDRAAVIAAPGRIMTTTPDTFERATAHYRVGVSADTYRKALAHARRMTMQWLHYDLATENCNKVLFEFAERLGLEVSHDMLDLPVNIVRGMGHSNVGRSRASWRPAGV